jgi:hypothetical protein
LHAYSRQRLAWSEPEPGELVLDAVAVLAEATPENPNWVAPEVRIDRCPDVLRFSTRSFELREQISTWLSDSGQVERIDARDEFRRG